MCSSFWAPCAEIGSWIDRNRTAYQGSEEDDKTSCSKRFRGWVTRGRRAADHNFAVTQAIVLPLPLVSYIDTCLVRD
jgi:hypothetical protein